MIERLVRIHSVFLQRLRVATMQKKLAISLGMGISSATAEQHEHEHENGDTQRVIDVSRVNQFFRLLEDKTLLYKMFARDTKASRNRIKSKELLHACCKSLPTQDSLSSRGYINKGGSSWIR